MPSSTPFKWDQFHPHGRLLCQILNDYFGNSNWPQRQQMFNEAAEAQLVAQGFPNGIQEDDRVASQFRESKVKSHIWDEIRSFANGDDSQRALYQRLFNGLVAIAAANNLPGPSSTYADGGGFVQQSVTQFKTQMASEVIPGRTIPPRAKKAGGSRKKVAPNKGSSKGKVNAEGSAKASSSKLPAHAELVEDAEEDDELASSEEFDEFKEDDDEEAIESLADQENVLTPRADAAPVQTATGPPAPPSPDIDHEQGEDEDFDAYRLRTVQPYERGDVVNDHYSQQEYKTKRLWFLDRHPSYGRNVKLMPKVNQELADVFASGVTKLSMQAVRRLELEKQIDPLTPLTMTGNMQTVDGTFDSYPNSEWTAEMDE